MANAGENMGEQCAELAGRSLEMAQESLELSQQIIAKMDEMIAKGKESEERWAERDRERDRANQSRRLRPGSQIPPASSMNPLPLAVSMKRCRDKMREMDAQLGRMNDRLESISQDLDRRFPKLKRIRIRRKAAARWGMNVVRLDSATDTIAESAEG